MNQQYKNHQYKISKDAVTKITPWSNYSTDNNRNLSALRESTMRTPTRWPLVLNLILTKVALL